MLILRKKVTNYLYLRCTKKFGRKTFLKITVFAKTSILVQVTQESYGLGPQTLVNIDVDNGFHHLNVVTMNVVQTVIKCTIDFFSQNKCIKRTYRALCHIGYVDIWDSLRLQNWISKNFKFLTELVGKKISKNKLILRLVSP